MGACGQGVAAVRMRRRGDGLSAISYRSGGEDGELGEHFRDWEDGHLCRIGPSLQPPGPEGTPARVPGPSGPERGVDLDPNATQRVPGRVRRARGLAAHRRRSLSIAGWDADQGLLRTGLRGQRTDHLGRKPGGREIRVGQRERERLRSQRESELMLHELPVAIDARPELGMPRGDLRP